jgi:hypothetical protein
MSFVEDVFKGGNIVTGLAIGIGCVILAPVIVGIAKPLAKAAVRGGVALYKIGRDAAVDTGEAVSDIVAEAKAELHDGTET